jgi:hypothetical protein
MLKPGRKGSDDIGGQISRMAAVAPSLDPGRADGR